mgnify:CR=1 FL=1
MARGSAQLNLYGQFGAEYAVGGMNFMIGQPLFKSINQEVSDGKVQIYAKIDDDADASKMKSVTLAWYSNSGQKDLPMVYDQNKNAYKLQDILTLPADTANTLYKVIAEDKDGNKITSDLMSIESSPNINLYISRDEEQAPKIAYTYSFQLQKWGIKADVESVGKSTVSYSAKVSAFDKDPDRNNDGILDPEVKAIGEVIVNKTDWVQSKDDQIQTSSVFIPCSLSTGKQIIFIWIDIIPDASNDYSDDNKNDNIAYRIIEVAHSVFGNGQFSLKSSDNVLQVAGQADTVKQDSLIAIERIEDLIIAGNQPSMSFVQTLSSTNIGYKLFNPISITDKESPSIHFNKPVSLKMRFDLTPLRNDIKKEIGLGKIADSQLDPEQLAIIENTLKDRVSNVGVYMWHSSAKRWSRMPSNPALAADNSLMKSVQPYEIGNSNDGLINSISIDENSGTPIDEWDIVFTDNQHFNLQGAKSGIVMKDGKPYVGAVGEEFFDSKTGIRLKVLADEMGFEAGDRLKFRTVETATIDAESEWSGIFSLIMTDDNRPPNIQLDIADQNFANGNVVSSEPKIHALISDSNGIDLLSRKLEILMSIGAGDFEAVNQDDYVSRFDPSSNDVTVNYAPKKLEPDNYEVKFLAYDLNGNLGMRSIKFVVKGEFEIEKNSLMNYPNPFELETDITFQLSSVADDVTAKIYTVSGRLIRTLDAQNAVNFVMIHWDGKDEDGKEAANGVYYYKLRLKRQGRSDIVEVGKMMKLK